MLAALNTPVQKVVKRTNRVRSMLQKGVKQHLSCLQRKHIIGKKKQIVGHLIPKVPQDLAVSTKHLIRRVEWKYIGNIFLFLRSHNTEQANSKT